MNAIMIPLKAIAVIAVVAISGSQAWAGDVLTIRVPRHSELTPVQKLNREGVVAIKRLDYQKAAELFYKAYLYDPSDPFTLNNLGYVSELQGELERARKFYALASEQGCNANIDMSNAKKLEGKPMQAALESLQDVPMRVNRMNVDAMGLLEQSRGFEAVALLHRALALDPQNPFTLNNLGVADETVGDFEGALRSYNTSAQLHSSERVVVTLDRDWRGKAVSEAAAASEKRLKERLKKMNGAEEHAVLLTLRGVTATNQNDWLAAKENFLQAYSLDPNSAFAINNRGFVAEMDGDLETAEFFYEKARKAGDSNARVGLASQRAAEGKRLTAVATESDHQVDGELGHYSQERRLQTGPIALTPRGAALEGDSIASPEKPSSPDIKPVPLPAQPVPQIQ
jgi:Flp pilus assembly protein TadD